MTWFSLVSWLIVIQPSFLGQRQRIALARALAVEPRVLLLDEPFGALDAKVRKELRRWLRTLHDELHITSIFVTHDQEEALEVADQIVVMNKGDVEQIGSPREVYETPKTPFVFDFWVRQIVLKVRIMVASSSSVKTASSLRVQKCCSRRSYFIRTSR